METLLSLLVLSFCVISVFIALYFRAVGQIAAHRDIYRDIERAYKELILECDTQREIIDNAANYVMELEDKLDSYSIQLDDLGKEVLLQHTRALVQGANAVLCMYEKDKYVTERLDIVDRMGNVLASYNRHNMQFQVVKHGKNNNATKIPVNSN